PGELSANAEHVGGFLVDIPTLLDRVQNALVLSDCCCRSPFTAAVVDCDMNMTVVSDHTASKVGKLAGEVLHVGLRRRHATRDRAEGLDERVDSSVVFAVLEDVGQERVR